MVASNYYCHGMEYDTLQSEAYADGRIQAMYQTHADPSSVTNPIRNASITSPIKRALSIFHPAAIAPYPVR
jgi:hypothetical protein